MMACLNKNVLESECRTYSGIKFYKPAKLYLSEKLDVDPEFRAEYDAWLLARFGLCEPTA